MDITDIRAAVANGLEQRDIGLPSFHQDIRDGRRDDTPFMVGALILAQVQALTPAE